MEEGTGAVGSGECAGKSRMDSVAVDEAVRSVGHPCEAPFTSAGVYSGSTTEPSTQVSETTWVRTGLDGSSVFQGSVDVFATLDGEGAECTLNGLYLAGGDALVDNHTAIDHAKAHCPSGMQTWVP